MTPLGFVNSHIDKKLKKVFKAYVYYVKSR